MNNTRRTSIDKLAVAGFELSEEHLSLASGGMVRTRERYGTQSGSVWYVDVIYSPDAP